MDEKKLIIELETEDKFEIKELHSLLREYNQPNLITKLKFHKKPQVEGEMAGTELHDILSLVLYSTPAAIALKGLFDVFKTHILAKNSKGLKAKYKDQEIELTNCTQKQIDKFINILKEE